MIYYENASYGMEGFNTHLLAYTFCISFSNFLDRDFFFDYEIPSSTPPDFAFRDEYKDKFKILLESERSLVTDLVEKPAGTRRRFEIDRHSHNKISFELLYPYFATTEEIKAKFGGTFIWDSFAVGREGLIKEQLQSYDLIEWLNPKLSSPSVFYFLNKPEKDALLKSVQIKYREDIENLARKIVGEQGKFNSFHLRLGDFLNVHKGEFWFNVERFKKYVKATFADTETPILAATDGLYEKALFSEMLEGYKVVFIDELIFDEYREDYENLNFTDFNVLTILNQLICANSEIFIGTYRSTMTSVIHRLREERFNKTDFNFFPDEKVARLLAPDFTIKPDKQGFFDWNKYSVFSENQMAIAWMREWNFDFCSLNF
jgi:hypothetical protein